MGVGGAGGGGDHGAGEAHEADHEGRSGFDVPEHLRTKTRAAEGGGGGR
jgi:hypothetical protein